MKTWIAIIAFALMNISSHAHAQMKVYPLTSIFDGVNMISLADVKPLIIHEIQARHGIEDEIKLQVLQHEKGIRLESDATEYDMELATLDVNTRTNQFRVDIAFIRPNGEAEKVSLLGRYDAVIDIPVLARRLKARHVLSVDDIEWKTIEKNRLRADAITDIEELEGKMLKRSYTVGRPLRTRDVMEPLLVERNASVNMVYETPYMTIRTTAVALEEGGKGDVIRVRNANSALIVRAIINNATEVRAMNQGGRYEVSSTQ